MPIGKKIKVLIVDDSLMFRTAIAKGLESDTEIEVVGTAFNTYDARDKIKSLNPDVLTLDVEMPGMSGIEFLKILLPQHPMPVVVVSAVDGIVFEAMRAGAVDFIAKPDAGTMPAFVKDLAAKIKIAAVAKLDVKRTAHVTESGRVAPPATLTQSMTGNFNKNCIIAIGASTGGTEATSALLKALPESMPGIVITQHMPPVFTRMYAERLNRECKLEVKEAEDGDVVRGGHAYVAPGDRQMRVVKRGTEWALKVGGVDKVSGHCPSVDVLFESMSTAAAAKGIGIILTGMGADGSKGMLKMRGAGAYTIGQDKTSCVVYGMPMEAMKLNAVVREASLDNIPSVLLNRLKQM